MRLKNMYLLCKNNIDYFKKSFYEGVKSNDSSRFAYYTIVDFKSFVFRVNELSKIKCLESTIEKMCNTLGNTITHTEKYKICVDQLNKFKSYLDLLTEKMQTIIDLGESIGFESIENGFDIKLPPNLPLGQLGQCITDLDKAFSQCPLLNNEGDYIEFKNVDVGSFWLEFITFATGSSMVIINLAKIVDKCVVIKSHMLTVEKQKKELELLEVENEIKENMLKGYNAILDKLIDKCSEEIQKETENTLDNEGNERLKLCLNRLSNWMSKGLEIHAAFQTSKDIKDIFPKEDNIDFLPKELIAIKDNKEDS